MGLLNDYLDAHEKERLEHGAGVEEQVVGVVPTVPSVPLSPTEDPGFPDATDESSGAEEMTRLATQLLVAATAMGITIFILMLIICCLVVKLRRARTRGAVQEASELVATTPVDYNRLVGRVARVEHVISGDVLSHWRSSSPEAETSLDLESDGSDRERNGARACKRLRLQ